MTDIAILTALNGASASVPFLQALAVAFAAYFIFLVVAGVAWCAHRFGVRLATHAAVAAVLAYAANAGISHLWFRSRPFVTLPDIVPLVGVDSLRKSFPSDHAALSFALAFSVFLHRRREGAVLLAIAALVSLGRVMAGVHYPTDVLAGALVGIVAASAAHWPFAGRSQAERSASAV